MSQEAEALTRRIILEHHSGGNILLLTKLVMEFRNVELRRAVSLAFAHFGHDQGCVIDDVTSPKACNCSLQSYQDAIWEKQK